MAICLLLYVYWISCFASSLCAETVEFILVNLIYKHASSGTSWELGTNHSWEGNLDKNSYS